MLTKHQGPGRHAPGRRGFLCTGHTTKNKPMETRGELHLVPGSVFRDWAVQKKSNYLHGGQDYKCWPPAGGKHTSKHKSPTTACLNVRNPRTPQQNHGRALPPAPSSVLPWLTPSPPECPLAETATGVPRGWAAPHSCCLVHSSNCLPLGETVR